MSLILNRVALARTGANDKVICRMASGWAVMGDVQFLPGYCLLLPDPVVPSLNDLDAESRTTYPTRNDTYRRCCSRGYRGTAYELRNIG